jgi:cysteine desulfurase / selenocysteine lyase
MGTPANLADIRSLFPSLKRLTWLNAAASSPLCEPVALAVQQHLEETLTIGDRNFSKWFAQREALRHSLAQFLGCTAPELALTPSTSFGINIAAQMLRARGIRRVVTLASEFPSTTVPFLHQGLTLDVVARLPDGSYRLEDIVKAASTPDTAVALSVVQYASGYRVDVDAISAWCKQKQVPLVLNAAQALGQVPLRFEEWSAAFLAAPCHKWMMAGYGMALLCIRRDWLEDSLPMAGWLSTPSEGLWNAFYGAQQGVSEAGFEAHGVTLRREASTLESGGGTWSLYPALSAALALYQSISPQQVLAHNIALQLRLRGALRARGFAPNAPDDPVTMSGICGVAVAGGAEAAVRRLLEEAALATTARQGVLRISTHLYNTEGDVDTLMEALDKLQLRPFVSTGGALA